MIGLAERSTLVAARPSTGMCQERNAFGAQTVLEVLGEPGIQILVQHKTMDWTGPQAAVPRRPLRDGDATVFLTSAKGPGTTRRTGIKKVEDQDGTGGTLVRWGNVDVRR